MICCHEFFESIRTTSKRKSTKELIAIVPGLTIQGKIRGPCHLLWQSQVWGLGSSHELTREVKLGSKSSSKDHEVHYKKLVLKFCRQEEKCGFPIRKISMGFPASTSVELFGDTFKLSRFVWYQRYLAGDQYRKTAFAEETYRVECLTIIISRV